MRMYKNIVMNVNKKSLSRGIIIFFIVCVIVSSMNIGYSVKASSTRAPNHYAPTLSNGTVTPQSGDTSTLFTYQVTYQDLDNVAPSRRYVIIDYSGYYMYYISGSYQTGAIYQLQTTLWGGNHTFYFDFDDGKYSARLPQTGFYYGPNVSGPSGGWVCELYQGNVTPQSGNPTTVFTYQVTYFDYFNDPPINRLVYIDGFAFTMNFVSGNYTNGAIYQYQTTLGLGNHTFYFYFNNSYTSGRLPYNGSFYGPAVTYGGGAPPNNPPILTNGFVNPQLGTPNTLFTYQVTYTDPDGNPPVSMNVYIDGTPNSMTYNSGSFMQGAIYQYQTTLGLGSEHTFYFHFADWNASVRLPIIGEYNAPLVSSNPPSNNPPTLEFGSVVPGSGTTDTLFTYQVTYTDADNYPPVLKYIYIDGVPYVMNHLSGIYSSGAVFQYQTTLLIGMHNYHFYFSDGQTWARLPTSGSYSGPTVTPSGIPTNNPPSLYYGTVTPQTGSITTMFSYNIYYYDREGTPPTVKNIYIDGMAYQMSYINGSFNSSALFQYNTTLPGGNHTYYFEFCDGQSIARSPIYGSFYGPSVSYPTGPNNQPALYNGTVTPQTGNSSTLFTYQVTYKDLDNDTPIFKSIFIDNQGYVMSYLGGNFTAGAIYQFNTTLSPGNHTYYFYFSDGIISAGLPSTGTYSGPNVNGTPPNNIPILYSGSLFPNSGTTSTLFTYQLIYRDLDNEAPTIRDIIIDGNSYPMNFVIGTYNLGALYEYKTTLSVGVHNYYFQFSDGKATVRLPTSGTNSGPVVTIPNEPPTADAGADQNITVGPPHTVYFDASGSFDPNNDTLLYYWDFMDGDYAIGNNVSHIFHGVGDYKVSLTVWDGQYSDQDYCIINVIDSGQGKTQGKAPEKHPTPGFEGLFVIVAMVTMLLFHYLKRRKN